jgi:hypothetical protein
MELLMSKTDTVSPLRQRLIEDMAARKLVSGELTPHFEVVRLVA